MNLIRKTTLIVMISAGIFTSSACAQTQPIMEIPSEAGSGLDGRFWKKENLQLTGLSKEILHEINSKPADATFTATTLSYGGNDRLTVKEWLGKDAKSLAFSRDSEDFIMDGSIFSFTGLIAIPEAGEVHFRSSSDDGSIVWINGEKVISNDFYGAIPGNSPDGKVMFLSPGLYPIEIMFYNAGWRDYSGTRGEGIINFTVNGEPVNPNTLYSANTINSTIVFPSAAERLRPEKGTGLVGRFWKRQGEPLSGLAGEGLHTIANTPSHGMFTATRLKYSGNELLLMTDWLKEDSLNLLTFNNPEIANIDETLFSFKGLISIPKTGNTTFRISSDDGTIVWIGGQKVIDNDGYRAAPGATPDGTGLFLVSGLYPIEIFYYNGAYVDEEAGTRGEGILEFTVNGKDVDTATLYTVRVFN